MAEFRKIAGKPVWDEWIAKNKARFDAQADFDSVWQYAEEAKNR